MQHQDLTDRGRVMGWDLEGHSWSQVCLDVGLAGMPGFTKFMFLLYIYIIWLVLSDEEISKRWLFSEPLPSRLGANRHIDGWSYLYFPYKMEKLMEPQNSSKSLASHRKTMKSLSDSKIQIDGHLTTTVYNNQIRPSRIHKTCSAPPKCLIACGWVLKGTSKYWKYQQPGHNAG